MPQKLAELHKLFERIQPRDNLTIPTTSGFNTEKFGYIFTLGIYTTDPTYTTPRLQVEMFCKIPLDLRKTYSEEQLTVF